MKVVIIGASGHFNNAIEGIKQDKDVFVAGVAPGSKGENVLCDRSLS